MRLFAPSRVVCFFPPQGTCSQGSFSSLRQQRLATSLFEDTVFSPHHDDRRTRIVSTNSAIPLKGSNGKKFCRPAREAVQVTKGKAFGKEFEI
ncbi:hypothetical protein BaRGS_00039748 [Batillaria attramentaria]|uniref:Uncharacterized protein n=1 Tax=Batillaria attramentaria TaxID=370345 RepID=A0ABD0J2N2_9CAEN